MVNNQDQSENKHRFPRYFYNGISYLGVFLSLLVFVIECFLFGFDFFTGGAHVYLGMITYVILPTFLLLGLLLIPIGALWTRRRIVRGLAVSKPKLIRIDLNRASHRNVLFVFLSGTMILIIMTAVGSYKAFHYTESVHFCGVTCHEVMKPQYTSYSHSPHARVKCADCHIGSCADWYVRSKLSGVRQVFATIGNTYPRPIPTPIKNLRPAKETCEQCHWPGKFYSSFEIRHMYYPKNDEGETFKWFLRMLIHGGESDKKDSGIHAHMYVNNDIYYLPVGDKRQEISWIKSTNNEGKETVYTIPDSEYRDIEPPKELLRKMDCMDCHNRPSHQFKAPYQLLNNAMTRGHINPDLPSIKEKAMEVMSAEYSSKEEAVESIREELSQYYQKVYGPQYVDYREKIDRNIDYIVLLYSNNFFPSMNVRWDVYPENIGHLISPGCFRCHDGEHKSAQGKVISRDCNICHTIIEQGPPDNLEKSTDGLPFQHPVNIDEAWKEMNCYDCHTGGAD